MGLLQRWAMSLEYAETAELFVALTREGEAIAHERDFDHETMPLPLLRVAQRLAVEAAAQLCGEKVKNARVTIEAERVDENQPASSYQATETKSIESRNSIPIGISARKSDREGHALRSTITSARRA